MNEKRPNLQTGALKLLIINSDNLSDYKAKHIMLVFDSVNTISYK